MGLLSFLDLSVETGNSLYMWGWRLSLFGAAVTLIGVGLLMWGTRVRDRDFESRVSASTVAAAQANERAETLANQTEAIKADTAKANATAAQANERAAGLTKAAAEAQLALERERIERLKLEARIAPRRITQEQRQAIAGVLASAQKPIVIEATLLGDQEAELYGEALLSALQAAGAATRANRSGYMSPPQYGVQLTLDASDAKALAVRAALEAAGIHCQVSVGVAPVPGQVNVYMLVGLKPIS
jgi:uncharacterized protein YigA (DUF484 family)